MQNESEREGVCSFSCLVSICISSELRILASVDGKDSLDVVKYRPSNILFFEVLLIALSISLFKT